MKKRVEMKRWSTKQLRRNRSPRSRLPRKVPRKRNRFDKCDLVLEKHHLQVSLQELDEALSEDEEAEAAPKKRITKKPAESKEKKAAPKKRVTKKKQVRRCRLVSKISDKDHCRNRMKSRAKILRKLSRQFLLEKVLTKPRMKSLNQNQRRSSRKSR